MIVTSCFTVFVEGEKWFVTCCCT